jgi:hypothetical protein
MKQYSFIGWLVITAGILKRAFHNLMRHDFSLWPRPLDGWFGRLLVGRRFKIATASRRIPPAVGDPAI